MNILITSAGRRQALLESLRGDARRLRHPLRVLAADLAPELSAACASADAAFAVPPCSERRYVDALLAICQRERIQMIIPTIDGELQALADSAAAFAKAGSLPVVSLPDAVQVARDKARTA